MKKYQTKLSKYTTDKYTLEYLESLPTLHSGHFDNLKIEEVIQGVRTRVWLSRMTIADGMPYDNQVTIEQYRHPHKVREDGSYGMIDTYSRMVGLKVIREVKPPVWEKVEEYEAK